MIHAIPLRYRIGLGLAAIVMTVGVVSVGLQAATGRYADTYVLTATFPSSGQGLDTSSTVKLRGVTVGEVSGIRLLDDGRAEVTLEIQDGVGIADTVTATAEPLSVFGPKFVRLDPGEHELTGPYLAEGAVIERTAAPVEVIALLEQAASLLDAIEPADLRTIIGNLAIAVDGLGPRIGATLDDTALVVDVLEGRRADIAQLLGDLATVAGALGERGDELTAIATDLSPVLGRVGEGSDEIGRLLDATSRVSFDLAALVSAHAADLDRVVERLGPTVQVLFDQLACVPGFLEANAGLIGLLGENLLAYELPGGRVAGVVAGPASFSSLLEPIPTVVDTPVARCFG
ncbi:MAG: MCE family protein [Actinomycetota bacterium]|nr:MCE family protein [Acidimicrobiia bacterium]MDQ3293218.1 MCE family protein [Actinomycetota bacterium]